MQGRSLIISLGLHGALVLAALVVLPNPEEFKPKPQESIQVDISNIGLESKKKAQTTAETKPADKPKPKETKVVEKAKPKPKVAEEVKTAAVEPVKVEPPPEPKKEPIVEDKPVDSDPLKDLLAEEQKIEAENAALAEKKLVEKKRAEDKKKQADEKKKAEAEEQKVAEADAKKKLDAEKKKQKLNVDQLEALLNKTEGETAAPLEKSEEEAGAPEKATQDVQGNDDAISATIVDALVSKVKECFNVPPAAREANLSVRIHFQLNQDGSVRGQPDVANFSADPVFEATARAAVSAIVECQTYDLPQDRYDLWQDNTLDFNPNLLFGT